ncbi:MAG: TIGR04076 family protein [Clostridia bacterium]|nr:TIGR04076 family protein [Clostridia bacterium]
MKDIKITVMKKVLHSDLIEKYENPILHSCDLRTGDIFISKGAQMPNGFCESAWQNVYPFVFALSSGAKDFYDGWMKDKESAMISCNDGFRPVSFYIETVKE